MNTLQDTVWQRTGFSWIWDDAARNAVCSSADQAYSIRQFLTMAHNDDWPDTPRSLNGRALVVAGLGNYLDLLAHDDAEDWLGGEYKLAIRRFQSRYGENCALIFWMPSAKRLALQHDDSVVWVPQDSKQDASERDSPSPQNIEFGLKVWGKPNYDVLLITPDGDSVQSAKGGKSGQSAKDGKIGQKTTGIGFYYRRFS